MLSFGGKRLVPPLEIPTDQHILGSLQDNQKFCGFEQLKLSLAEGLTLSGLETMKQKTNLQRNDVSESRHYSSNAKKMSERAFSM